MSQDVGEKYEDALRKIEILIQENNNAKSQNNHLSMEIKQLIAKVSANESAHERQIYELTYKLTNESKATFERDRQELTYKFQADINKL